MTREELITNLIDQYTMLQEIKEANGDTVNKKLDYKIKTISAKLESLGVNVENLAL